MNYKLRPTPTILLGLALAALSTAQGATLVSDTWLDGERATQEAGTDGDFDGNIESAWFGTASTLTASAGHLVGTVGAGSSSWTTYFASEGSETTLANAGDTLTVQWTFTLTGTNTTNNSQGFRLAFLDTPSGSRLSADGNPGSATYAGYGMFMNAGQTLGHANPFNLMERAAPGTASAMLSAGASWTSINDQETSGVTGYADATAYTFTMTLLRTATNGLMINASMSGGSLGGDGLLVAAFEDTTPNSFAYDTFSLRPSSAALSASSFDTTAFSVVFTPIPEPSTFAALAGLAGLALAASRRHRA
jgi:hypothetical protein